MGALGENDGRQMQVAVRERRDRGGADKGKGEGTSREARRKGTVFKGREQQDGETKGASREGAAPLG